MWSHLFEVFCCFTELKWKDKDGREQSKREGKIGNEEVGCVCVCVCVRVRVCVTEESLHEQQLLGSLRALAGAGNHRSRPCSHALTVSVCECVWVCVSVCAWMFVRGWLGVYALRGKQWKRPDPLVRLQLNWNAALCTVRYTEDV